VPTIQEAQKSEAAIRKRMVTEERELGFVEEELEEPDISEKKCVFSHLRVNTIFGIGTA
jgi:hypothetical protein